VADAKMRAIRRSFLLSAGKELTEMRTLLGIVFFLLTVPAAFAEPGNYLYRAELVQAAPGKLVELTGLYGAQAANWRAGGDAPPFMMRHSQGDHWDLMLLYPMQSYADYYSAERIARRQKAESSTPDLASRIQNDIAWQEDLFAYGPPLEAVKTAFANARFFHIEMLHALPGAQADLYKEREVESVFQRALNRPELFIFVRDQGAAWDVFSIDFYHDIKHYAESADIPLEKQQAAARAAGFANVQEIGPYLRKVIAYHHDTLAVAVTPPPHE
jgi:hypothetical protein